MAGKSRKWRSRIAGMVSVAALGFVAHPLQAQRSGAGGTPATHPALSHAVSQALARPAIHFVPNRGQSPTDVRFSAIGPGYNLSLKRDSALLDFDSQAAAGQGDRGSYAAAPVSLPIWLQFVGGEAATIEGTDRATTLYSYFRGRNRDQWITRLPSYEGVTYRNVYPGIDLVFGSDQGVLEYTWRIAPEQNPNAIRLRIRNYSGITVDEQGNVVMQTAKGSVRMLRPVAYQIEPGGRDGSVERRDVPVSYRVADGGLVRFKISKYDHHRALVIDPFLVTVASSTSSFGTNEATSSSAVAVDASGNAWVGGSCYLAEYSSAGALLSFNQFAFAVQNSGQSYPACTVNAMAVDSNGNLYLTGDENTASSFPITDGLPAAEAVNPAAYLMMYSPTQSTIYYSVTMFSFQNVTSTGVATTYNCPATPTAMALDPVGDVFVTGAVTAYNCSVFAPDPVVAVTSGGGIYNGGSFYNPNNINPYSNPAPFSSVSATPFVFEENSFIHPHAGPSVSTLLGGAGYGYGTSIAVGNGLLYVAGITAVGGGTAFPLVNPLPNDQAIYQGATPVMQGFVAAITTTPTGGHSLLFSTPIPGTYDATGVAADNYGDVFVTGTANLLTGNGVFTTVNPLPASQNGSTGSSTSSCVMTTSSTGASVPSASYEAYVMNFNPNSTDGLTSSGLTTNYATLLGVTGYQGAPQCTYGYGLSLDATGNLYVFVESGGESPTPSPEPPNSFLYALQFNSGSLNGYGLTIDTMSYPNPIGSFAPLPCDTVTPQGSGQANSCGAPFGTFNAVATGAGQGYLTLCQTNPKTTSGPVGACNPGGPYPDGTLPAKITAINQYEQGALGGFASMSAAPQPLAILSATTNPINFGSLPIGAISSPMTATLTNNGPAALFISSISVTGTNAADFTANASACPVNGYLAANGGTCNIPVTFTPSLAGSESATLTVEDHSGSGIQTIGLSGTGVVALSLFGGSISNGQLNFGTIGEGTQSATQTFTINNTSGEPLNINASVGPSQFQGNFHESYTCSPLTATGQVQPFGSCLVSVYFEPSFDPGTNESATIVINSGFGATNLPAMTINLTGTSGARPGAEPLPELVSVDNEVPPQASSASSFFSAINTDASEVSFTSSGSNLPGPGGSTGSVASGLYLHYTCNGLASGCAQVTQYISYGPAGGPASNGGAACNNGAYGYNQGATNPQISADGRYVAFNDDACAAPSNNSFAPAVAITYLRDVKGGSTTAPLLDANGNPLAGQTFTMSADARFFAFTSAQTNIIPGGLSGAVQQIYIGDTCVTDGAPISGCKAQNYLVSQDSTNTQNFDNSQTPYKPTVSPDGRFVAFLSSGTNLVAAPTNGQTQVYLRDTCLGATGACTPSTILVSADNSGNAGNGSSSGVAVSSGGRFVAFLSAATNLPGSLPQLNSAGDEVYLRDTCIGAPSGCMPSTTILSRDYTQLPATAVVGAFSGIAYGAQANYLQISADGRVVSFDSSPALTNSAAGVNGAIYAYDTCESNGTQVPACTPILSAISGVIEGAQTVLVGAGYPALDPTGQFVTYSTQQGGSAAFNSEVWLNSTGVTAYSAPLTITTSSLPGGTAGLSYSGTIATSGGIAPVMLTVGSGTFPPGLSLNQSTGGITGTPDQAGSYTFTITATGGNGGTTQQQYTVAIGCPAISFHALPAVTLSGGPTTVTFPLNEVEGMPAPGVDIVATVPAPNSINLTLTGSGEPAGESYNASTGLLGGTPTVTGSFTFTAVASAEGCSADSGSGFAINVAAPTVIVSATLGSVTTDSSGNYLVTLNLKNQGNVPMNPLSISGGSMVASVTTGAGNVNPSQIAVLEPGSSAPVTLTFSASAAAAGSTVSVKVNGSASAENGTILKNWAASVRGVVLP